MKSYKPPKIKSLLALKEVGKKSTMAAYAYSIGMGMGDDGTAEGQTDCKVGSLVLVHAGGTGER